jgi:hypothetical protein
MFKKIRNKLKQLFFPKPKSLREEYVGLIKSFPQIYGDDYYGPKLPFKPYYDYLWNDLIRGFLSDPENIICYYFLDEAPQKHAEKMLLDFHNKKILPLFVRWLKENNKWNEFQHNKKKQVNGYVDTQWVLPPYSYLTLAFTWRMTPQGQDLWARLNREWSCFLSDIFKLN